MLEPSRTTMVTFFTGSATGVPEHVGGGRPVRSAAGEITQFQSIVACIQDVWAVGDGRRGRLGARGRQRRECPVPVGLHLLVGKQAGR